MKTKLFSKELFGGMGKTVFFAVMTLISTFLICFLLTFTSERSYAKLSPNVTFSGLPSRSFSRMYEDISRDFAQTWKEKLSDEAKVYQFTTRYSFSITKPGQISGDDYFRYACEHEFLEDVIKEFVYEGRIPEKGKKEILLGGYLAHLTGAKIGDTVSYFDLENKARIEFSVTDDNTEIPYEVVGILNSTGGKFDYSVLFEAETQENVTPNTVWIYLPGKEAVSSYRSVNGDFVLSNYGIGTTSENIGLSGGAGIKKLLPLFVTIFAVVLEGLLLAYAMKGISRKLGILKALGIRDKYIFECYLGGIAVIQLASSLISVVVTKMICNVLNNGYSEQIGFPITVYSVSARIILLMLMITAVVLISLAGILKIRVNAVSPKKAMIS